MSKKNVEWEWKKLGDVCYTFDDGDWIESSNQSPCGIRLIQTGNIGCGIFKDKGEKARYISENTFKKLNCTEIFPGDCLISRLPNPLGRACILPNLESRMITAVDCTIVRFNKFFNSSFFLYYSQSTSYQAEIDAKATGTTRSRISRKNLAEISIPIPPLDEQERIVKVLDDAFEKIDTIKTTAETNLQNAKDLFDSALTKELNVKKNILCQMKEVCDVRDGTHDSPKYHKTGYPLVTSKNLKDGKVNFEKIKLISEEDYVAINKRSKVNIGDVLFAMIGTIGNPVLITEEPNYAIKNMALFKPKEQLDSSFLQLYLNSPKVLEKMNKEANGSTQRFVGLDYLRNFQIPLPPLSIQKQIVAKLDSLSEKVKQLESNYKQVLADCDELKKALLKQAFEGML